jgi:hypothetical protein
MRRGMSSIFVNAILDLPQHVSASHCLHQGVVVSSWTKFSNLCNFELPYFKANTILGSKFSKTREDKTQLYPFLPKLSVTEHTWPLFL